MNTSRMQISSRKVGITRILLLLPFVVLGFRAAHLSVDQRGFGRGEDQVQRTLKLAPKRGAIVDSSGAELALSVDSPSIYAIKSQIDDRDAMIRTLAPVLGMSDQSLKRRLSDRAPFIFLARWVDDELAQRVGDLKLKGIGILKESRRVYPHGNLAAQIIGFSNIDAHGIRGIEQQEDQWLRGTARRIPVERDARGKMIWTGDAQWNTVGGDTQLTIDAVLQAQAEAALKETVARTNAKGGVVIVMDPWSGDILTLAENPGFNPKDFRTLSSSETRSHAFLDALVPGSTLKAFLVAAAIDAGAIAVDDVFDCEEGSFRVPGKTITDHHPHSMLSAADILRVSSNIGAVKIAHVLGRPAHYEALRRFGFGSTTGSQFPGESAGLLRPWEKWQPVDHATIAFGQGINVTPIQLAAATSALANGGLWFQPRLIAARRAPGGEWLANPRQAPRQVLEKSTADAVLKMLEGVVDPEGTGSRAGLKEVRVAGKTGTAQKYDSETKTISNQRFEAWFIGAVPADDPKIVIVVGVDEPKRPLHTGGASAAPLFASVAAAQLTRYGIFTEPQPKKAEAAPPVIIAAAAPLPAISTAPPAPVAPTIKATEVARKSPSAPSQQKPVVLEEILRLEDRVLLPDFRGLTVAEVKQMTAAGQLQVEIFGRGRAVKQTPPPGTIFALSRGPVQIHFKASGAVHREGKS